MTNGYCFFPFFFCFCQKGSFFFPSLFFPVITNPDFLTIINPWRIRLLKTNVIEFCQNNINIDFQKKKENCALYSPPHLFPFSFSFFVYISVKLTHPNRSTDFVHYGWKISISSLVFLVSTDIFVAKQCSVWTSNPF